MFNKKSHITSFLLTLLFGIFSFQVSFANVTYPVDLSVQLLPPYSNCLSDYVASTSGMNRLNVNLLQRDLNHSSYQVVVQMTVKQGSQIVMQTRLKEITAYTLTPGIMTSIDPERLFSPASADVEGRYASNGYCLPEGGYEFVFQVFDANHLNVPLSQPQRIFTYLSKAQPPFLTFPFDGSCVSENSTTITFTWMDAIATSPIMDKKFLMEVFEMPQGYESGDDHFNGDKNAMIASGATKVYSAELSGLQMSCEVPVTAGTFVKGRSYIWRVKAFSPKRDNIQNGIATYQTSNYYENGGYSAISTFTFKHCADASAFEMLTKEYKTDNSVAPELLRIDTVVGPKAVWKNEIDKFPYGYYVEYNTSDEVAEWSRLTAGSTDSTIVLPAIGEGIDYVVRVIGIKGEEVAEGDTVLSGYSNKLNFKLKKKDEQECGNKVPALTSIEPIEELRVNETITANGQNVFILSVEKNSDGTFTGTGASTITFLGKLGNLVGIKVEFKNIKVNKNRELMEGVIYTVNDPKNSITLNANGALNENYTGTGEYNLQSSDLGTSSNSALTRSGDQLSWTDSNGNVVNETVIANNDIDVNCAPQEGGIDDNKGTVTFSSDSEHPLPFDYEASPFTAGSIKNYYTKYGLTYTYNVPWIAMVEGTTGRIKAKFETGDNSIEAGQITFVARTAKEEVELPFELVGDNTFTVEIFAGEAGSRLDIYAIVKKDGADICQEFTLGRAMVATLKKKNTHLHIVPVFGATVSKSDIEKKLKEVYAPFGKTFDVEIEDNFGDESDAEFDFLKDGLAVEGTKFMKTETAEMSQLKQLYQTKRGFKANNTDGTEAEHAYLFVLPKAETSGVMGDMPRCKPAGYIFLDGNVDIPSTIAHEIGHGVFALEHTFEFSGGEKARPVAWQARVT